MIKTRLITFWLGRNSLLSFTAMFKFWDDLSRVRCWTLIPSNNFISLQHLRKLASTHLAFNYHTRFIYYLFRRIDYTPIWKIRDVRLVLDNHNSTYMVAISIYCVPRRVTSRCSHNRCSNTPALRQESDFRLSCVEPGAKSLKAK